MGNESKLPPTTSKSRLRALAGSAGAPARRLAKDWLRPLLLALLIVTPFRSAVADWHDVPTGSMKPGIVEGDRVVVDKRAYRWRVPLSDWVLHEAGAPQRGDVVTLRSPREGTRLLKRVVAVAGDKVALRANRLWLNGRLQPLQALPGETHSGLPDPSGLPDRIALEELAGREHKILLTPGRRSPHTFPELRVPAGHVLVLGDNRDNSADSRYFGFVPLGAIEGRVIGVAFSFDPRRWFGWRSERFLLGLK